VAEASHQLFGRRHRSEQRATLRALLGSAWNVLPPFSGPRDQGPGHGDRLVGRGSGKGQRCLLQLGQNRRSRQLHIDAGLRAGPPFGFLKTVERPVPTTPDCKRISTLAYHQDSLAMYLDTLLRKTRSGRTGNSHDRLFKWPAPLRTVESGIPKGKYASIRAYEGVPAGPSHCGCYANNRATKRPINGTVV